MNLDNAEELIQHMSPEDIAFLQWQVRWMQTARPNQIPPEGDWTEAGFMAGRGFGKTRVGAEWITRAAYEDPSGFDSYVICPTLGDVKRVAIEGESGILSVLPPELLIDHNKTDLTVTIRNCAGGESRLVGFSAERPERLRGPQACRAWCFAAGTPVLMADGSERAIETVRVGDEVSTRFGPRRVRAAGLSGNKGPQVRISFGATSLTATADHPILTARGWIAAGELRTGDVLWSVSGTGVCLGGSGQTVTSPTSAADATSTDRSTRTTTALSQSVTTSIIRTTIQPTTTLTISKPCFRGTTPAITRQAVYTATSNVLLSASACWARGARRNTTRRPALSVAGAFSHVAGASLGLSVAHPVWSGGAATPSRASSGPATSVARATTRASKVSGSVARRVTSNTTSSARPLTARQKPARIAARSLHRSATTPASASGVVLSPVRVASVERLLTREPVYDLTVNGEHEFVAAGVVVHNCDELAAWQYAEDTWDMMQMGLRLGPNPQVVWTTTPKPREIIRRLTLPKAGRIIVKGSTDDNRKNLPKSFFDQLAPYRGTKLGRQELEGELIDPEEAGIVQRSWINLWPANKPLPQFERIIMSLDTAFTERTLDKKGDPDPTACGVWGVFFIKSVAHVLLLDCWEDHLGFPDLLKRVKREMNTRYGDDQDSAIIKPLFGSTKPMTSGRKPDMILIEDKGSGISLRQALAASKIEAYAYNPGRADKLSRLHIVSPIFAQRRVWVPESDRFAGKPRTWCENLIGQLCSFAGEGSIKHDDHVDQCTQALRVAMDTGLLNMLKPTKEERDQRVRDEAERISPTPVVNPYAL